MIPKLHEWTQHAENFTARKICKKPMLWYRNVRNQIASNVWESHNPVHKLTTNRPQMERANWSIFER